MSRLQDKSYGIKTRHSPALDEDLIADIVFVHGLTGSADSTWTSQKDDIHWPSQLLCQDITDVRVSTFGYDADVVSLWNPVSQNRLGNHAENLLGSLVRMRERTNTEALKIIFVAHSLGGLVVQSALAVSRESTEPHLRQLEACTAGICFLGTPHLGSDLAQWGRLGALLATTFRRANTDIVKVLSPGSEMLAAIQERFFNILNRRLGEGSKISITCFYEELAMPLGGLVVPERCATLPGHSKYGIHANHREMTKFRSRSDIGYIDIVGELQRWTKAVRSDLRAPRLTSDQEDCLKSLHFPSSTLRQDTARDAALGTFEWIWSVKDSSFPRWLRSRSGVCWISGKPGSGKTTMMKYLIANRGRIERYQTSLSTEQTVTQASSSSRDRGELSGKPGSGKTTVMKDLIAKLGRIGKSQTSLSTEQTVTQASSSSRDGGDLVLAAHFFDHEGDRLAHSVTGLLRSLIFQLLRARPQLFDTIWPRYQEMRRFHAAVVWSDSDLRATFKAMLLQAGCGPFIFFIDALDESDEEQANITKLIIEFSRVSSKNTQFCVSSRPSADFSFYLDDLKTKISLDKHSSQDIHRFVSESFQELASRFNTNYGILIDQVVLKAENVFLWARLVVEDLLRAARRRETVESLLHRLLKMPAQMNSFYQRMLDQASDYDRHEVLQILGIVWSAMEPLSIEQLQDVMEHCLSHHNVKQNIGPEAQKYFHSSLSSAENFAERVESMCFGLVEVRTTYHRKKIRKEVAFPHHTVLEFLELLDAEREKQGRTKLIAQGNIDLLSGCVDSIVVVNTSGFFRVASLDEQLHRQTLTEGDNSSASNPDSAMNGNQGSWTVAELNVQAFVICPFLRYAASHWAQHAKVIEFETGMSCHSTISKLSHINFRLWSLLMRRSDESWNGVEGRQYVTPSTLLEYAAVFGLSKFLEEELQSYLTNTFKMSQSEENKLSELNMIYPRLLYAAATGGSVVIAEALMVWGARLKSGLRCMSDALSRAIYRMNFDVASVLCEHGALSNVAGVYLEGFTIQSQYRTPDVLTMRIAGEPSRLEASPMALLASLHPKRSPVDMFDKCADFDARTIPTSIDYMARLAEWDTNIAIDDFAIAFSRSHRNVLFGVAALGWHTSEDISKQTHTKMRETHTKIRETYVLNEAICIAEGYGTSIKHHVLTVKLLPMEEIESSLAVIMDYKAAYGRLPKLDITPFNLTSSVSPDLTKCLLDLGYNIYEHHHSMGIFQGPFSMEQTIPLADEEADWNW